MIKSGQRKSHIVAHHHTDNRYNEEIENADF